MNKILTMSVLAAMLAGCGSDSEPSTPPPPTPDPTEKNVAWNYIETPYIDFQQNRLQGQVYVALGAVDDNVAQWLAQNAGTDTNADGAYNYNDVPAGIKNTMSDGSELTPRFAIDAEDLHRVLATDPDGLGAGTARPDIFVEGNYSAFDVLRYLVATRDDMRFEEDSLVGYQDSKYNSIEFRFSWDKNQNGDFTDDGEYSNSSNWHYSPWPDNGNSRENGNVTKGEFNYNRMDTYWVRPNTQLRFQNFSDAMTARRLWVWDQEAARFAASGNKFVVPKVLYKGLQDPGPQVLALGLEVKPFNLRKDVFQPGVITTMDVWLTLAHEHNMDFRFSWWPTMSSGAIVDNFSLSHDPFLGTYTGWTASVPKNGESATFDDFHMINPQCNFKRDGSPMMPGELTKEECQQEWLSYNGIGGSSVNEVIGASVWVMPPEVFLQAALDGTFLHEVPEVDLINHPDTITTVYVTERMLESADLSHGYDKAGKEVAVLTAKQAATSPVGNAKILDDNHFGWKIADCTLCHNETKQPLGHGGQNWPTNQDEGFDYSQPHFCATCHGNNGAVAGHNRGARCFWCHNNQGDLPLVNHGDAGVDVALSADELMGNQRTFANAPLNYAMERVPYDDMRDTSNTDYYMSRVFPSPYSCLTCHAASPEAAN